MSASALPISNSTPIKSTADGSQYYSTTIKTADGKKQLYRTELISMFTGPFPPRVFFNTFMPLPTGYGGVPEATFTNIPQGSTEAPMYSPIVRVSSLYVLTSIGMTDWLYYGCSFLRSQPSTIRTCALAMRCMLRQTSQTRNMVSNYGPTWPGVENRRRRQNWSHMRPHHGQQHLNQRSGRFFGAL